MATNMLYFDCSQKQLQSIVEEGDNLEEKQKKRGRPKRIKNCHDKSWHYDDTACYLSRAISGWLLPQAKWEKPLYNQRDKNCFQDSFSDG